MNLGRTKIESQRRRCSLSRAAVAALMGSAALSNVAACAGEAPCASFHADPTLRIRVDPALAQGVAITSGACSPAECTTMSTSGCVEWHARMADAPVKLCTVTLRRPDAPDEVVTFGNEQFCSQSLGRDVDFAADGGPNVFFP